MALDPAADRGRGAEVTGLATLTNPNPENKLFVGGAPPGTDEQTLQQVAFFFLPAASHRA